MRKIGLLARLTGTTPLTDLSPADLASRRSAAEAALAEAERLHRRAALNAEGDAPGASAVLIEAVEALRLAQEKVRDVMAAQIECEAHHAERQRLATKAREDAEDATVVAAYAKLPKAAGDVQVAALAYVKAWRSLLETGDEVRHATAGIANPRGRTDLMPTNAASMALVALELTRLTPEGSKLPPGADAWAAVSEDRKTILPITDHFEALASAVRESLGLSQ